MLIWRYGYIGEGGSSVIRGENRRSSVRARANNPRQYVMTSTRLYPQSAAMHHNLRATQPQKHRQSVIARTSSTAGP